MSFLRKMNFESSETTLQLKLACVGPQSAYKVTHIVVRRGVKYGNCVLQVKEVPCHHHLQDAKKNHCYLVWYIIQMI